MRFSFPERRLEDELVGLGGDTRLFTKLMFIVYIVTNVILGISHNIYIMIIMKTYIGTIL